MPFRRCLTGALAAALLVPAAASAAGHTVLPGETLSGIAAVNGMSAATVAAANGLSPEAHVVAGTTLTIPAAGAAPATTSAAPAATTTTSAAAGSYRVVPGDSLSAIAARQGVSTSALATANGLRADSWVISGTALRLPSAGAGAGPTAPATTTATSSSATPQPMGGYTVRSGDTLSGLAAIARVPMGQIAAMNGLSTSGLLLAGTVIKLPTGSAVQTSTPAPARTIVPQAAPEPSSGRLSSGQIGSLAASQGAPGSLASAIAWQESGFNNAMVSNANARGIMQVMPGTWAWVQQNLSRSALNPASAADNVKAGSLYLAHLLRQTNGDPSMAAAAYYQGLASVRRIGMLPETRRYVANVLALRSRFGG